MTLRSRPSIDDLIASLLPADWALDLICWRDDGKWEIHLLDGATVWFGYGSTIDSALAQALEQLGGSFNRAQRPLAHQPAKLDLALEEILQDLRPKLDIGRRI